MRKPVFFAATLVLLSIGTFAKVHAGIHLNFGFGGAFLQERYLEPCYVEEYPCERVIIHPPCERHVQVGSRSFYQERHVYPVYRETVRERVILHRAPIFSIGIGR